MPLPARSGRYNWLPSGQWDQIGSVDQVDPLPHLLCPPRHDEDAGMHRGVHGETYLYRDQVSDLLSKIILHLSFFFKGKMYLPRWQYQELLLKELVGVVAQAVGAAGMPGAGTVGGTVAGLAGESVVGCRSK